MKTKTVLLISFGLIGALFGVAVFRRFYPRPVKLKSIRYTVNYRSGCDMEGIVSEAISTANDTGCRVEVEFTHWVLTVYPRCDFRAVLECAKREEADAFARVMDEAVKQDQARHEQEIRAAAEKLIAEKSDN
jgi:hypothetical protein